MRAVALLLLCVWQNVGANPGQHEPQQIHIAYGEDPVSQIVVTWSTFGDTFLSIVEYGETNLDHYIPGNSTLFVDGGPKKRKQYIHRVTLSGLLPNTKYNYKCGSPMGWSRTLHFTTMKNGSDWSPRLAVYGDLGRNNPQSLPYLLNDFKSGMYDAIIHVGDFAYDMDTANGHVGDAFMRLIQPIAAHLPYMVCVGNHENKYNFSHYKSRFSMPGESESLMYSFNMGPVHFIGISTEFYYFLQYGLKQVIKQYFWLEQDLKEASKPENRAQRPWIIIYGHRPMYCSNSDHDDCTYSETLVRVGVPVLHWYGLEKLLYKYGVDLAIWAHEHSYERLWPIFDKKVYNGSLEEPYTNPGATVHVTSGSAGCQEDHDDFPKYKPPWSAFRTTDYGFMRLNVYNASHLHWEQISADKNGTVIDSVWIKNYKHGPFGQH